jgi:hypothetical protein
VRRVFPGDVGAPAVFIVAICDARHASNCDDPGNHILAGGVDGADFALLYRASI